MSTPHSDTRIRIASQCCLICGLNIGYREQRSHFWTSPELLNIPQSIRKTLPTQPEVRRDAKLYCATEVENAYHPNNCYLWMGLYQLINLTKINQVIYRPDTNEYTLSGVGLRIANIKPAYVPWDQSKAFIDQISTGLSSPDLTEVSMTYLRNQDHDTIGYPMHMHCWTMARATGSINEPGNLGLFCQILWKEWTKFKQAMNGRLPEIQENGGTSSETGFISYRLGCQPPGVIAEDPLRIHAVKKIIDTSTRSPWGPHKPRIGRNWKSLPDEIQLLILDKLSSEQIEPLATAYRDAIPGVYWWHIICRKLRFEEHVLEDPNPDLESFGSAIARLSVTDYNKNWETRWQWSNRNKIFTFLTLIDEELAEALIYGLAE
ncbi:hypothetical protein BO94DRAFT_548069 [Aspergillus sclerotioniger CBS 115572]|uniref:F-box domain-containing protein n=1 Tax=Aspergillus sclerotioniger CBS 115572 TaxID=1450535 RepID=A0A317W441_9EURO|nr:hypothetical protein BO94DRAFT_548069 [Aspergillus sclerotioniger CBS 115572]PWY80775.1 hypothetical protein BO94DRAFT_548069 [Aspergillus sclerotioniger CBS 115572]